MDTDSFIVHVKIDEIYKKNCRRCWKRSDTSNFEIDRTLPIGKNKKVIGLMEDELGGQIIKIFVASNHKKLCCIKSKNI